MRKNCFVDFDYHDEAVADPQAAPANRTLWNIYRLAVHSNYVSWSLTDYATKV